MKIIYSRSVLDYQQHDGIRETDVLGMGLRFPQKYNVRVGIT